MSDPGHKLYDAAADGKTEDVRLLLAEKEPLEYKNVRRPPPTLLSAFSLSHSRVQRACWRQDKGLTPLIIAAKNGKDEVVRLLLEAGAEKEAKSNGGFTPLSAAAYHGHDAVVRLLLEAGADKEATDEWGQTPIIWAYRFGREAVVQLLLEAGSETILVKFTADDAEEYSPALPVV